MQVLIFRNTVSPHIHWIATETAGPHLHQQRGKPCRLLRALLFCRAMFHSEMANIQMAQSTTAKLSIQFRMTSSLMLKKTSSPIQLLMATIQVQ